MKKIYLLFVCVSIVTLVSAQKKTVAGIDTKNFEIAVSTMFPVSYPSVTLSDEYGITLKKDSIICHLPYMGEAHVAPIDNDGLNFKQPIKNYQLKDGKKGKKIISFKAQKNAIEQFDFTITIFPNGSAEIYLLPSNAQSVSYNGEIVFNN